MTMPDERYRAVVNTQMFLYELCNPEKTPRVPKSVRQTASWLLRHYPSPSDMKRASHYAPDIFAENIEEVTRLFKQYELSKVKQDEA
jgi:hypothetical protein